MPALGCAELHRSAVLGTLWAHILLSLLVSSDHEVMDALSICSTKFQPGRVCKLSMVGLSHGGIMSVELGLDEKTE